MQKNQFYACALIQFCYNALTKFEEAWLKYIKPVKIRPAKSGNAGVRTFIILDHAVSRDRILYWKLSPVAC
jgi:hypothetical protein